MIKDKIDTLVICGATASGKTQLSLDLSNLFDIELISADSRQLFRYMNIGTAKPSKEELALVPHWFIDWKNPDEFYSAGQFGREALAKVKEINSKEKLPVVVGGSGLYIQALVEGIQKEITDAKTLTNRELLNNRLAIEGIEILFKELQKVDNDSAELYKSKNPRRVIRALEYYLTYGKKFSENIEESENSSLINPIYIFVDKPRDKLYLDINNRCDQMWQNGLLEETQKLLDIGYGKELNSMNTVGYKEVIQFFEKELTENEAIEKFKKVTRNYAKRQITWFRRIENKYNYEQNTNSLQILNNYVNKLLLSKNK